MATVKKLTELNQANSVSADTLIYIVKDPSGVPESLGISVKKFLESNVSANVSFTGTVKANTFNSSYHVTPANNSDVPVGFEVGTSWSDGDYIYYVTDTSELKRVALSSW